MQSVVDLERSWRLEPALLPLRGVRVALAADGTGLLCAKILRSLGAVVTIVRPPTTSVGPCNGDPISGHLAPGVSDTRKVLLLPAGVADGHAYDWHRDPVGAARNTSAFGDASARTAEASSPPRNPDSVGSAAGVSQAADSTVSLGCAAIAAATAIVAKLLGNSGEAESAPLRTEELPAVPGLAYRVHDSAFVSPYFALLPARDGLVRASLLGDWTTLAHWAVAEGAAPWLTEPKLETLEERAAQSERLFRALGSWTSSQDRSSLTARAQLRRLPWAAVRHPSELWGDPHLRERNGLSATFQQAEDMLSLAPLRFWCLPNTASALRADGQFGVPSPSPAHAPLSGVRVLDFTWAVAGPLVTRVLAHLGASVLRVLHPSTARAEAGTPLAAWLAAGKQAQTMDLSSREIRLALWREQIASSHILIDNFSTRVLDQWGLTPHSLLALPGGRAVVRMPAFGLQGRYAHWVGFGPTVEAWSGFTHCFPSLSVLLAGEFPVAFSDFFAALWAVLGTLAALFSLRRGDPNVLVEVSQFECTSFLVASSVRRSCSLQSIDG